MANNCKYYKEEEYQSLDGGITWTAMGVYRKGDLLEFESPDCGTPTPSFDGKFRASYNDSTTYSAACNGNTSLTTATTRAHSTSYTAMTTAEIGDCVTSIGDSAFLDCINLTTCTIGSGVTSIGNDAFYDCYSLSSVTIPDSVTSIGRNAFDWCYSLTSIDIPDSVTSIGGSAFDWCTGITSVTCNAVTPPTIGAGALQNTPIASGTGYIYVPCNSVDAYKEANNWSTYASQIQGIPPCSEPTPTFDGKFRASYNDSTTYSAACNGNTTLTSTDTRPSGYEYSAMTTAQIGPCVTSIGEDAFRYCSGLTNITIPDSVTSIGIEAFAVCPGLTSVTIPDSVTSIGIKAFRDCRSLTSVTIGTGVTSISGAAFARCTGLTSIDIPDSVTSIGNYAFGECSGMTTCTIGTGVTSIGIEAFRYCSGLTSITVNATTPPTAGNYVFNNTNKCPIYVPCASVDTYKAAWSTYADRIQGIPPCGEPTPTGGTKFYATYNGGATYSAACDGDTTLTTATTRPSGHNYAAMQTAEIGSCVTSIGTYAFYGCRSLTSCTIGTGITAIGEWTFAHCSGLTSIGPIGSSASVEIPSGVTSIGENAFKNCTSLTSVTIPSGVTSIDGYAFGFCTSLSSITIPDSVTSLGHNSAFYECTSLTSVTIGSGVTDIGSWTFAGCTSLVRLNSSVDGVFNIPDNITTIGNYTFKNCTGLTSVNIPSGVTRIAETPFEYCTSLTSVTVNATTPPLIQGSTLPFNNTPIASGTGYIYVPCDSVDSYKSAYGWSAYTSVIQAIPGSCTKYRTISGAPYCEGYDKYVDVYSQISYDNGNTWETTATTPTLVEAQSSDCGYVPPTPTFDGKFRATYTGGTTYSAACDGDTTLTSGNLKPSGYDYSAMTTAEIGDCVTTIGNNAFSYCTSLASVTIPNGVTTIGTNVFLRCINLTTCTIGSGVTSIYDYAFQACTSLTSIDIPSGVTSIGNKAFRLCNLLASVTINAVTPPTAGSNLFQNTPIESGTGYIYVPAASVDAYKSASGWSTYASRIQPIT